MDVGIINYNGGAELLACVKSLNEQNVPVNVFVFDNDSADDSLKILRQNELNCIIIESKKNLGYAGACNELLNVMSSDVQVLCNMDLEFDKEWSKNILECFERNPKVGSVASLVMEKSGVVNAVGVEFGKDLFAKNEGSGLNFKEANIIEKEVFGCYGAVMSFKKEAALLAGKMDDSFFLFFEETEWYFRHNLAGFKTVFCPKAKVYHERSLTTVRYSPSKLYYSERNRLCSAFRLLPFADILKLPWLGFKRYISMAKAVPTQSGDGKKLSKLSICKALAKAWIEALLKLPAELKIRKSYQLKFGDVQNKVKKILVDYSIK